MVLTAFFVVCNGYAASPVDEVIDSGKKYLQRYITDQAISEFTKAIQICPNDARGYSMRGIAYALRAKVRQDLSDFDRAIPDLNKAIELNPLDYYAYATRALAYNNKGDFDQGLSDYAKAIELIRAHGLYYDRALFYFGKQEYDKSWEYVRKAEVAGHNVHKQNPNFIKVLREKSGRQE